MVIIATFPFLELVVSRAFTHLLTLCVFKQGEQEAAADGLLYILQLALRLGHDIVLHSRSLWVCHSPWCTHLSALYRVRL